jgi:antitoxin component YwqK of YwqJK toxin-antitoxin module
MILTKKLFIVFAFFACYLVSEDCNAQKINQFNANNQRTGVWKKYHPNKKIRYTGAFIDGKEIGVFKFYDSTSAEKPTIIKTFFKDSDSLFVKFYTLTGKIKSEGALEGRKRVGSWKYFYPNGTIMSQENYKDGKLHGAQLVYYPEGKVTELSEYKNGLLDGISSKFSSKGILIEEVTYKNGIPNGLAKFFELNGDLKETGVYKNGKREENWAYYLEGEIASKEEQKKAKRKSYIKQ